jgi:hypothetical protein
LTSTALLDATTAVLRLQAARRQVDYVHHDINGGLLQVSGPASSYEVVYDSSALNCLPTPRRVRALCSQAKSWYARRPGVPLYPALP